LPFPFLVSTGKELRNEFGYPKPGHPGIYRGLSGRPDQFERCDLRSHQAYASEAWVRAELERLVAVVEEATAAEADRWGRPKDDPERSSKRYEEIAEATGLGDTAHRERINAALKAFRWRFPKGELVVEKRFAESAQGTKRLVAGLMACYSVDLHKPTWAEAQSAGIDTYAFAGQPAVVVGSESDRDALPIWADLSQVIEQAAIYRAGEVYGLGQAEEWEQTGAFIARIGCLSGWSRRGSWELEVVVGSPTKLAAGRRENPNDPRGGLPDEVWLLNPGDVLGLRLLDLPSSLSVRTVFNQDGYLVYQNEDRQPGW
jgi:hypothetical protein